MSQSSLRLARFGLLQLSRNAASGSFAAGATAGTVRFFSEGAEEAKGGFKTGPVLVALAAAGGGLYAAQQMGYFDSLKGESQAAALLAPTPVIKDYGAVKKAIADVLDVENYDDGSYGPVLVRLAWHASGTYDKATGTGGSNGATMRFAPEADHGANAGLQIARDLLEPIKKQYPWISYADLWTLAGAVAIEEMGGPHIPWRPGRVDKVDGSACPPDGRLPDGDKGAPHVRDIFYRMGFNDGEIVALLGAHTLGRCHTDRSGFDGPWTNAPTTFSNLYFTELKDNKWRKKKWSGPPQYEDKTGQLMMLPTDMALLWDRGFRKYVDLYAKDEEKFFADYAAAFSKLLELGVDFPEGATAI